MIHDTVLYEILYKCSVGPPASLYWEYEKNPKKVNLYQKLYLTQCKKIIYYNKYNEIVDFYKINFVGMWKLFYITHDIKFNNGSVFHL